MKFVFLFLSLFLFTTSVFSQAGSLKLVNVKRNKVKIIEVNSSLVLLTSDKGKIKGTLKKVEEHYLYLKTRKGVEHAIDITTIDKIKLDRFQNTPWLEPFGYLGLGAGLFVVASPFVWIFEGGETALEALEFAGILTSISLPAILIGNSKRSFNLNRNWDLSIGQ